MPSVRQTNFGAGEVAPGLWGRTDLSVHAKGCRTLKNFFVDREGSAVSRPGTLFVHAAASNAARLIPFVVSDADAYVCEFGTGYIRFFCRGVFVRDDGSLATGPTDGATPLQVTTTYLSNQLREIQFAQVGATLVLTHPAHPPRTLTRNSAGLFTLADITFNLVDPLMLQVGTALPTNAPYLVNDPATNALFFLDADHPPREWRWVYSTTLRETATGRVFESKAFPVTRYFDGSTAGSITNIPTGNSLVLFPDAPVTLRRPSLGVSPLPAAADYDVLAVNFYRGRGGVYGFVGSTETIDFVDAGAEPDYSVQPLLGTNPFANPSAADDRPVGVAFFQERRVWTGTNNRPTTILASATGNYSDHDKHAFPVAGEALEFELAAYRRERARWGLGAQELLLGTDASIWAISGGDAPLDFDSVQAKPVDAVGATSCRPLMVGNTVLYVRSKGRGARALSHSANGWQSSDISHHARHLFVGGETPITGQPAEPLAAGHTRQIVEWAYAEDPWGLVWAVRDDGVLLSCTISPAGDIAWARHETDGFVWSVCSVPESTEDAVYVVVQRAGRDLDAVLHVERMTSRVENDAATDGGCVDDGIVFRAVPTTTITGLAHLEGKQVYAVGVDNVVQGPLTVSGGSVTLPVLPTANDYDSSLGNIVTLYVGLLYQCDIETLDLAGEGRVRQKSVTSVGFEVSNTRGLWVGQDANHLDEWRQRAVSDGYGAVSAATDVIKVAVRGTYDFFARAYLRQTLPLPVTVLGLVREVDAGG